MTDEAVYRKKESWLERASWGLLLLLSGGMIFSLAVAQIAAVLLIVTFGTRLALRQGPAYRRTHIDYPLALFFGARILSIVTSVDPWRSAPALHTELIFYLVVPAVTNTLATDTSRRVRSVLLAAIVAGGVAALYGAISVAVGWDARASSTTGGYYTLGIYLAAVLPLLLLLGGTPGFLPGLPAWGGLALLIGFGLVMTFNRLHWAAAMVAVIFAGVYRERRVIYAGLVVGLLLLFVVPGGLNRLEQAFQPGANMSGRDILWKGAAMIGGERPLLGHGPRTFPVIFPLFDEIPDKGVGSWHNDYLQVYMETGVLGIGSLAWFLWSGVAPAVRRIGRRSDNPADRRVLVALLSSVGFFVLFGGMFDVLVGLLFKIIMAALVVCTMVPDPGEAFAHRPAGPIVGGTAAAEGRTG